MYTKEHIRSLLSSNDQIIFDQIENHTLLGASNHIKAIGTMIENLANSDNTPDQIIHNIKLVCNYYIQTRGKASQAISNAIFIMISNIDKINLNSSEFRINIINRTLNGLLTFSEHDIFSTDSKMKRSIIILEELNIIVRITDTNLTITT